MVFTGPIDKTKSGNRHAPSKKLLLSWIKQSWDAITPDVKFLFRFAVFRFSLYSLLKLRLNI